MKPWLAMVPYLPLAQLIQKHAIPYEERDLLDDRWIQRDYAFAGKNFDRTMWVDEKIVDTYNALVVGGADGWMLRKHTYGKALLVVRDLGGFKAAIEYYFTVVLAHEAR